MKYSDSLKLYICRLKLPGEKEVITYSLDPEHIREVGEEELFCSPICVDGSLERIDHEFWALSLNIKTQFNARCCVCNELFLRPVMIRDISHFIHYEESKTGIFDCKQLIRQELLLECDHFLECQSLGCPQRRMISDFLRGKDTFRGDNPFECL